MIQLSAKLPTPAVRSTCAPTMLSQPSNRAVITETGIDIDRYICSDLFGGGTLQEHSPRTAFIIVVRQSSGDAANNRSPSAQRRFGNGFVERQHLAIDAIRA